MVIAAQSQAMMTGRPRTRTPVDEESGRARFTGQYRQAPWGHLGMEVRIYRPCMAGGIYAMKTGRGVVATAETAGALFGLARRMYWFVR